MFLIDSIKTIKGINNKGVPWGTRWINIFFVLLIQPNNIKFNHKGIANLILIDICLVILKIYGNKEIKLFIIIKINNEIKKILKLLFFLLLIIT